MHVAMLTAEAAAAFDDSRALGRQAFDGAEGILTGQTVPLRAISFLGDYQQRRSEGWLWMLWRKYSKNRCIVAPTSSQQLVITNLTGSSCNFAEWIPR